MNKLTVTIIIIAAAALALSVCVGAALNKAPDQAAGEAAVLPGQTGPAPAAAAPGQKKILKPKPFKGISIAAPMRISPEEAEKMRVERAKEKAEWIKNVDPAYVIGHPRKVDILRAKNTAVVSDQRTSYGKKIIFNDLKDGPDKQAEKPGIMKTAGRLPDLRVYTVRVYPSAGYIKNSCDFGPPRTAESANIILYNSGEYESRDHFTCVYTDAPQKAEGSWTLLSSEPFGAGLTLYRYDIAKEAQKLVEDKNKLSDGSWFYPNPYKSALSALKTKDGTLVWASATAAPLSVRENGDGYIVVTDKGVDCVYFDNGLPSVDVYDSRDDYFYYIWFVTDEGFTPMIKSGRMLTDNIVRLEYDNGLVVHKKVKLDYEDVRANMDNDRHCFASILWHNELKDRGIKMGLGQYTLARGFNADTSREPSY